MMSRKKQSVVHLADTLKSVDLTVTIANGHMLQDAGPDRIHYLEGLVAKQLDLYNWCEEKVSTLATIDSILLGAATLFIEKIISVEETVNISDRIMRLALVSSVLIPLMGSLVIALWHIRPKMGKTSNVGRPNHRSSNGIRHFSNVDDYKKKIYSMPDNEICEDLIKQIYGMNRNIWINQKSIKGAVLFDLVGLVGFLMMIAYWVYRTIFLK